MLIETSPRVFYNVFGDHKSLDLLDGMDAGR